MAITMPRATLRSGRRTWRIGKVVAVLFACALVPGACSDPRYVERMTIVNPTVYDIDVELAGAGRASWLNLGTFRREGAQFVDQVIDHGDVWTFRFRHNGRVVGELVVRRDDFERSRWRLEIPMSIGARLQERGAVPSLDTDR